MCSSNKAEQQDVVQTGILFPSGLYQIEKPEFIDPVLRVAEEALIDVRKEKNLDEIYPAFMTGNLFDKPDIIPFQYYVGQTAYNILREQGYNLDGVEPYFSEMWCQEHYKHSAMEQHIHGANAQIVGFYFLECPENCSKVLFHDPRSAKLATSWVEADATKASFASNIINFEPKPGLLMFTNAWLPHSFSRHGSDKPIKFIHFNVGLRPILNPVFNTCVAPAAEIV